MKNAIVILFPEEEFLGTRKGCIPLFNECIEKRYLKNNYELVVVRYKGYRTDYTGGIVQIPAEKIITANITSLEQLNKNADFANIAKEITKNQYEQIVIGGFHCFDCVKKLAMEVYKVNPNILIDTDLTEQFDFVSKYYEGWNISTFNPELKIENRRRSFGWTSDSLIEIILDKYNHPAWGIPQKYIESLQEDSNNKKVLE